MVKPIKLEHIDQHARNPASDFSQGFVSGWLSYRRKAAPAVLVGGCIAGWLFGLATAKIVDLLDALTR